MSTPTVPQPSAKIGNRFKDMTGYRAGRLLVLSFAGMHPRHGQAMWLCQCDCGNRTTVFGSVLRRAKSTQSCGCLAKEVASKTQTTHGMTFTTEYRIWHGLKARCENPKDAAYTRYGGRGIKVCERWHSFENFLADMDKRPSAKYTLDRIDNDGDYCPENCRWATYRQQANNRRGNRLLTYDGKTMTLSQWARELGINNATLVSRLSLHGWSVDKALSTPVPPQCQFTSNGEAHTIAEWARLIGINYYTLFTRLTELHWSIEKALTTPARKQVNRKSS